MPISGTHRFDRLSTSLASSWMEGRENIAAALRNAVAAARIAARRSSEAAASAAATGHMGTLGSGRGPHLPGNNNRAPAALANERLQNQREDTQR